MNASTVPDINIVWQRIEAYAGEDFETKTGEPFTYEVDNNTLHVSRTDYTVHKTEFEKTLPRMPISGPGKISDDTHGASYIWGILNDSRIRKNDWAPFQ